VANFLLLADDDLRLVDFASCAASKFGHVLCDAELSCDGLGVARRRLLKVV